MLAKLRFVSISDWKLQKRFKNRLSKSCACVPLNESAAWAVYDPAVQDHVKKTDQPDALSKIAEAEGIKAPAQETWFLITFFFYLAEINERILNLKKGQFDRY
jgi:hypothetical protein